MKLKLNDVTLCAITSDAVDITIKALKYSSKDIDFAEIKLISDKKINEPNMEWMECPQLDYDGYNLFVVNHLHNYINTKFVLLIQWDGFVINPSCWRHEFFNYDYIGAPWPYQPESGAVGEDRIGNGGFSFRTKSILEAASKYNFPNRLIRTINAPESRPELNGEIMTWNEDGYFCREYKHLYKNAGFKYAGIDVAKYFSHEAYCTEIDGIAPFGFHGKQHANLISLLNTI
jgi:hypothetical protein